MAITGGSRAKKKKRTKADRIRESAAAAKKKEPKPEQKKVIDLRGKAIGEVVHPTTPTIDIGGPKKTGLAALREKPGVAGTVAKVLTSPKTTIALGATLATALTFGGAGGLAAAGTRGAATFARVGTAAKVGQVAQNAKTAQLSTSLIQKSASGIGMSAVKAVAVSGLIVGAIGSYPWAGHLKLDNVVGGLQIAIRDANEAGNPEAAALAQEQLDDILNQSLWEAILEKIPYANVLQEVKRGLDTARTFNAVQTQITEDLRIQQETGESNDEKWERIREQEREDDIAAIDYYNEQRKLMVDWEREAELAATREGQRIFEAGTARERTAKLQLTEQEQAIFEAGAARTRAANIKAMKEEAAFWRKERAKQRQMEAEDRQAIADFWLAYRKEALKIANDNRPSNLNFGLL